jgi:hypothetical protein
MPASTRSSAPSVTPADIARGVAAARKVFNDEGFMPLECAASLFKLHGEQEELTEREWAAVKTWWAADKAAIATCCPSQKDDIVDALELLPGDDGGQPGI